MGCSYLNPGGTAPLLTRRKVSKVPQLQLPLCVVPVVGKSMEFRARGSGSFKAANTGVSLEP